MQKTNKKLDNIFKEIWELPTEDLEILWVWFDEHTIVGGKIVENVKKGREQDNPNKLGECL